MMPLAVMSNCQNLHGQAADPLKQIQIMRALIQEHSSALSVPGCAPVAGIIICLCAVPVRNNPVHALNLAVFSSGYKLVHLTVHMICPLIEHHAEYNIRLCRRFVHLTHLLRIHTGRLFAHNMQSLAECPDRECRMLIMRNRNQHGVTAAGIYQLVSAFINGNGFRKRLLRPFSAGRIQICNSNQLHLRNLACHKTFRVSGSHVADTNDAHPNLIHIQILLPQ